MKVYRDFDNLGGIKNPVVTTGSFDGVHLGHKVIINRLKKLAEEIEGETVLITFHPHPRRVLYPDTKGKDLLLINSQEEKVELLEKAGLDNLIIIDFTLEFAKITSQEFIEDILVGKLHAKRIIVGFNHHFGHNRQGDYQYLYDLKDKHGFEVEEISQQDVENEVVSSTRIRKALKEGKIQRANAYLDHQYIITGNVMNSKAVLVERQESAKVIINEDIKLVPPDGIYATSLREGNNICKCMSIVRHIGDDARDIIVEVFFTEECSKWHHPTLYFHKRVRGGDVIRSGKVSEKDFSSAFEDVNELIY